MVSRNCTGGHHVGEVRVEGYEERKWGQERWIELKISFVVFCFFLGETVGRKWMFQDRAVLEVSEVFLSSPSSCRPVDS